jgi:hypothetical protein
LDPLLALRQMIAAVEWCLAKEERNAGGVSSIAWSCVQAEMGQKRLAEDGWALLWMHPLDERCPLSHNFTSSTAQGGGGSFKNRKPIGEFGCCESGMAERSH